MRAYRLTYLALLFLSFSTNTPLHAQENVTCPGFQPSRLSIGGQGQVTPGSSNNLRNAPARTGDKLGEIPGGGSFTVLDGPVCADDTAWWQVDYQGVSGWTVEGMGSEYWLEPVEVCKSNLIVGEPAERMDYGTGQIYEEPRSDSAVLGEIPEWTTFNVIGGSYCSYGEIWVEVDYKGVRGWFLEVALNLCDAYCNGEPYLNARLPLLPLQTVVPPPDTNPLSSPADIDLPPDAITAATASKATILNILGDGFVRDYAWSPDASQLAVAGTVEVRIYETHRLTAPLHVLTGFTGVVNKVLFSPDGRVLVTADLGGSVQLWDTETYDVLFTLNHAEPAFTALFSPDGDLLATESRSTISLWEIDGLNEPRLRHRIDTKGGTLRWYGSLIFIPGKDKLLDVQNLNIYVHDLATGETRQLIEDLSFHRGIAAWATSPNGAHVTAILEEMIGDTSMAFWYFGFTWDIETGEQVAILGDRLLQSDGMQISVPELKYTPDGRLLVITADQQEIQGSLRETLWLFDLKGVTDAEYSPDGSLLAFTLSTGEIRLYSGTQPVNVLYGISGAAHNPKFSPDGRYLAAAGSDGTLRVWNVETSQRLGTVSFLSFPSEFWLNTEQTTLIAGMRTWDIASGEHGTTFSLPESSRLIQTREDGRLLLKSENGIVVHDLESAQPKLEIPTGTSYFSFPTVSADGNQLAYIDINELETSLGIVKVVNLNNGMLIQTFQRQFEYPRGLYLSPDGRVLILFDTGPMNSEGRDYRLLVWDVATGNLLQVISTGDEGISDAELIFSPDGTQIAWRVESGLAIYNLVSQKTTICEEVEGFDKYAAAFAFNADGSVVALGDTVGDIHLFDTNTGEKLATLKGHISLVRKLVFSRDGRHLYSTADEGLLRIWGVP